MMAKERCKGCGKVIQKGQKVKTVSSTEAGKRKGELWGVFHETCFLDSVRSPQSAVERILLIEDTYGTD